MTIDAAVRQVDLTRHGPLPVSVCQDHNINILCKSGAETRAQYVAQLLGGFGEGADHPEDAATNDSGG